ncbi:hypothetical protein MCOR27_001113 [Pyricularia oryzae]|uniref:Mannosyl-oligosaccharide glucosidase n=1 Tax=Pyricularia grisea TaxID=148305 RepID=A0ABQ8NX81_PYRGI|nr:hypothetical protein MCOR01_003153 [Pyricularia oryzae]KAI6303463.1 hypothetical protein MCOR33_001351 [Pyricularia grisea]KAI6262294.1 hypothetical protein MCOR19_001487 [Pyricularia oryzae]KAI6276901.1 hypothetical protein MCOR26_005391 [Pyricularia oryzae]KAI6288092.1 hypothetical protein MCOR27_001113 [Pyricularia oryzae]
MTFKRQLKDCLVTSVLLANLFGTAVAKDESILHTEVAHLNNDTLLWGPYKPNLYFGVRSRTPKSLNMGLLWAKLDNYNEVQHHIRYTCEQNEGMAGYGWDEYDTRRGGVQTIHDAQNQIDISTSFVKIPGGANGGSWAARIKGELRPDAAKDAKTGVWLYITQEGLGSLETVGSGDDNGFPDDFSLKGNSQTLGDYKISVTKGTGEHPDGHEELSKERDLKKTSVQSISIPEEALWQAKPVIFRQLKEHIESIQSRFGEEDTPQPWDVYALPHKPGGGNAHIVQKIFEGSFEFDVIFNSASAGKELGSDDVTREIRSTTEAFGERFSDVFNLKAPFTADKYKKFGRSMFSNLIGGIGYFYGDSVVDRSYAPEYEEENEGFWEEAAQARARKQEGMEEPSELFTSIPSRPFFPRGFLWDEGFHLIPIADWDMDLTLEIVKSWFNLMDDDGWIAREQILGAEARSKVPAEFQVQYPHYANPPTLFFIIDTFVERLRKLNGTMPAHKEQLSQGASVSNAHIENPIVGTEFLRNLYPLLRKQYDWFRSTQKGDIKSYDREAFSKREAYRWRGRTVQHVLTSGLDDYPRPQPPHPGELHVDLMSWMGLMTKSLLNIADALGMQEEVAEFQKNLEAIERNLDDLHWSEKEGCYCDATIDAFEEHQLVCHKGYISLFPFITGLLKHDSSKLGRTLDLIGDEEELFSPHGIRSLSLKNEFYGTAENYWRSPVWININYLTLVQLKNVATQDGPYKQKAKDLYTKLRINLIDTVYKSWEETGFAWEQYNPETGKGQRTQHFTGWTSLVVKIMTMDDLGGGAAPSKGHEKDEL